MSIYGGGSKVVHLSDTAAQAITGSLVFLVFVAMVREKPPDVVFLLSLCVVMLCEILTLQQVLAGFANESLITIGALFLVIGAVQKSHVMELLAKKAFGLRSSNAVGTTRLLVSLASLSAFFNNIPLCNLMIPIVRDWARSRGIPLSHLLMPLSYTVIAGGLCTMIGTSTSLIVQGLMQDDIGYSFPFFTPGVIAVPAAAVLIAYMVFLAPLMLPARSGLIRQIRDKAGDFIAEVEVLAGSVFADHDIGTMMGRLGLQQDSVIKIRRPVGASDVDGSQHSQHSQHISRNTDVINADMDINLSMREEADNGNELQFTNTVSSATRRLRGRTSSDSLTLSPPPDTNRSPPASRKGVSAAAHTQGSNIADSEYVQQSRGAWGTVGSGYMHSRDDIAVRGYRPARLPARDGDRGEYSALALGGLSGSAAFTSPGALGDSSADSSHVSLDGRDAQGEDGAVPARYRDIINPGQFEIVRSGDVIFIASAAEVVTKVLKILGSERAGLKLLDSSVLDLPVCTYLLYLFMYFIYK
jgi:hypothetical protein